jgi:hypothetical protein
MKKICGNCKNFTPDGLGRGQCEQIDASYEVSTNPPPDDVIRDFNSPCIKGGKKRYMIFFEPKTLVTEKTETK